uniref:Uncharacterized protein n=1 Tax=Anguilla anguilla TaxID=7936 RepID=A0A0E9W460_ANGAN
MFLFGSADFMCRSLAHCFADSRSSHAVLSRCDPIGDTLPRHVD